MAYLLRALILIMVAAVILTVGLALDWWSLTFSHIQIAIPSFLYTIFAQAFVMFYFIGVARLANNVNDVLYSEGNLEELFDEKPDDLEPYKEKVKKFVYDANLCKRQTIPWTMLMLVLGMAAFLLGGAHDTGLVRKHIHSGLVYGFICAMFIGFVRQWYFLGKSHKLLRKLKYLFSIPDGHM